MAIKLFIDFKLVKETKFKDFDTVKPSSSDWEETTYCIS